MLVESSSATDFVHAYNITEFAIRAERQAGFTELLTPTPATSSETDNPTPETAAPLLLIKRYAAFRVELLRSTTERGIRRPPS